MAKRLRHQERYGSLAYTDAAFRPYVVALGQIALAWNGLHTEMAVLFAAIMGGGFSNQFFAVWHSIKNDRAQRDMLLAATKSLADRKSDQEREALIKAVTWICENANRVEDKRNDALHSPLWAYRRGLSGEAIVMPVTGLGHERAEKLAARKSLLAEFRWCRNAAIVIADYVWELDMFLTGRRNTWPETPSLPNRGETTEQKPRRRGVPKEPSRRHQSSRE